MRYNKAIIPYSILDSRVYEGAEHRRSRQYGLLDLDPAPHFDLVIIDEAHHIRNGSLDKDKAYAYKCVRYFSEHADAVVMLTATPLQTSDSDLCHIDEFAASGRYHGSGCIPHDVPPKRIYL